MENEALRTTVISLVVATSWNTLVIGRILVPTPNKAGKVSNHQTWMHRSGLSCLFTNFPDGLVTKLLTVSLNNFTSIVHNGEGLHMVVRGVAVGWSQWHAGSNAG